MFTNLTLWHPNQLLGVFLTMGFLFYLEIHKINKQVLEIQEQIHYLSNEVNN
jgi:hypothetical protein